MGYLSLTLLLCLLRQVTEYFEGFQSCTSDMKACFDSNFAKLIDSTQAKITTLNDLLSPQVEKVKEMFQTEDFNERIERTAAYLRSTLAEYFGPSL